MLLQFSVKNFKSIKNELIIDFRKLSGPEHKESLINGEVLPLTVLYGPNGSGKSNILQAIGYLFNFVSTPIRNAMYLQKGSSTVNKVPTLHPYEFDEKAKNSPSEFNVIFTLSKENPNEYSYFIQIKDGVVLSEYLYEKQPMGKPARIFERNGMSVEFGVKYPKIAQSTQILSSTTPFISSVAIFLDILIYQQVARFFTTAICLDFSEPTAERITAETSLMFFQNPELKPQLIRLLNSFNLGVKDFIIDNETNPNGLFMNRVYTIHENGSLPLLQESMGTRKIIMSLTPLFLSLSNGQPLVIDELDAKLHPKLLEFILGMFSDPNVNTRGSQLIITSHDMYTLNNVTFRRDEVWFVAKDAEDSTFCYSLVDIRNEKNEKERNFSSYSKRYLEGKYGADPYFIKMKSWEEITGEK